MNGDAIQCLRDAVARNSAAVVSLPSAGMLRHCKTRFLSESDEGFWIETPADESAIIEELIGNGAPAGIAFKNALLKAVFAAPILRRDREHRVNAEMVVDAILVRFPETLKQVQRRTNYRVQVPLEYDISVRIWKIPEHWILRDKPSATLEIPAKMRDLSLGGVGLLCSPKDGEPVKLVADQRLRVLIRHGENEVVVEGRARFSQVTPDNSLRLGVQFKKLENDLEGRQALSKFTAIIGELHRDEVRRARLSA